jgi:hypothetical protein
VQIFLQPHFAKANDTTCRVRNQQSRKDVQKMNTRELMLTIIALALGIVVGFAGNAALEGTAGDNGDDDGNVARVGDPRVLYQVTVEDMETFLLEEVEEDSELYEVLSAQLEEMKNYTGEEEFFASLNEEVEAEQIDNVLTYAYARLSDDSVENVEALPDVDFEDGEFELEVIIGEWADPYELEGASLQFYLKVPEDMTEDLPKDWTTLDKPLDTHIFWTSLRGVPHLDGQREL